MQLLSEVAVFLCLFGSMGMAVGALFYFGTRGADGRVMNPKFGIFSHSQFLFGLGLVLLCWIIKLIVYWIDPSIPMFGPAFMWYRMSREKGYYDDSFMN